MAATELRATTGAVNFTAGTGAKIQNDTTNNVLITSTTNQTDSINWRLGTSGNDILRLRYDANGGGSGIARNFLELYNPTDSQYYAFSGGSPYDVAQLTALLNNTSLTFNGSTTTTFSAGGTVLLNGTTTVAAGVTDIGKSGVTYGVFGQLATLTAKFATPVFTGVTYQAGYRDVANRCPLGVFIETYGTNTKVTIRGCCELTAGGTIPAAKVATLPSNAIPSRAVIVTVQGQTGIEQGRVDNIEINGDLIFQSGGASFRILNFSQISYFINV